MPDNPPERHRRGDLRDTLATITRDPNVTMQQRHCPEQFLQTDGTASNSGREAIFSPVLLAVPSSEKEPLVVRRGLDHRLDHHRFAVAVD